jgi:hypothetical protein
MIFNGQLELDQRMLQQVSSTSKIEKQVNVIESYSYNVPCPKGYPAPIIAQDKAKPKQ